MGDLNIGVVTAAWGDYGQFLSDWADSLINQTVKPTMVAIVDAGLTDPDAFLDAANKLHAAGLDVRFGNIITRGMGVAMNRAVELTPTEWIIRLDADDILLPHAIADVAELAEDTDVVSIGALRDGREVLFPDTSTEWILSGRQGAMSPSAFRRKFWEHAPFLTANDWIESAFWVGLAHHGARFTPTTRAGFVYRRHEGSHSATISQYDKTAARRQHIDLCRNWRQL